MQGPQQVVRQRVRGPGRSAARRLGVVAGVLVLAGGGVAYGTTAGFGSQHVGTTYPGGLQISSNQTLAPIGDRLVTPYGKFMGSAVSPDGRFLAATSTDRSVTLQIIDLASYQLVWRVGTATGVDEKLADRTVGQEAPTFSPDGTLLWLPQATGLTRFPVNPDGTLGTPTSVPLPTLAGAKALPGKAAYSADGSTLYVPLNGQNRVVAIDPGTGTIERSWDVGIAPREIAVVGTRLYVSDEGGRRATPGESTLNSYGTEVPADPYLGTATTGALSVIDTSDASADPRVGTIAVGLHPTALLLDGTTLYVANTGGDTVSVVDTRRDVVVQTIATQPWPSSKVGYEPTALALAGQRLLVTLGRANAVGVYRVEKDPRAPARALGLLPTDYFPADIATVGGQVVVTNTRGIDALGPAVTIDKGAGTTPATGHGTHSTTGSITRFTLPATRDLGTWTTTVYRQNGWGLNDVPRAVGRTAKPVPVPARLGDPSTIKHVFLLVKENRTYDQVYGDDPRGDGDASLAQFGEKVTPNQHALARQFGLYDNTYDIGTNSAEGHNWLMQGDDPAYTESSAGEYERSYDTEDDVLGHQRSGFLWTAVESAGGTVRDFGEFNQFETKPDGATWQQYYCAARAADDGDPSGLLDSDIRQSTASPIPSLNSVTVHDYPKFDTSIPDLYRYWIWKQDFEAHGPASLNMLWLSSDHTGGTPDPEAQVADGDLAVGRIVDEISHSRWWRDSAIFVVEDDSQDGVDHVDGHRAPIQVISPWAQHGTVVSTYYSQISMVRTIEQILGAQPLNQKVAAATPMVDAFTTQPSFLPFDAVPNQVPLTEGVATAPSCGLDTLGLEGAAAKALNREVAARTAVPADMTAIAAAWGRWQARQHFSGASAVPDRAHPEQMNRWTWYQAHQWRTPYPGDDRIYAPDEVPGGYLPAGEAE